jgi:hypothetical protein
MNRIACTIWVASLWASCTCGDGTCGDGTCRDGTRLRMLHVTVALRVTGCQEEQQEKCYEYPESISVLKIFACHTIYSPTVCESQHSML